MTESAARIDGLYNFRDTGGLPLTAGGASRAGVLFRSDALSGLTASGLDALAATPVGVVVDFRTPHEREAHPNRLPASRPFRTVALSILAGSVVDMAAIFAGDGGRPSPDRVARAMASLPSLGDMYVAMLAGGAPAFADVARLVAASIDEAPTAVLLHCTAGKDRTGVATALMLEAADVTREAVVADYAASQERLAGPWADRMLRMIASHGLPPAPALRALVTGAPPAAIEQALDWVGRRFGGAAGYLASGGLTAAELEALRGRLADQ